MLLKYCPLSLKARNCIICCGCHSSNLQTTTRPTN